MIKIDAEFILLWVAVESENKEILALKVLKERNMFIAERFLYGIVKEYGEHPIFTDGGTWYPP